MPGVLINIYSPSSFAGLQILKAGYCLFTYGQHCKLPVRNIYKFVARLIDNQKCFKYIKLAVSDTFDQKQCVYYILSLICNDSQIFSCRMFLSSPQQILYSSCRLIIFNYRKHCNNLE